MVDDDEVYKGIEKETQRKYKRDIIGKYGKKSFIDANKKIKKLSKKDWNEYQNDLNYIFKEIAIASEENEYNSEIIQELIEEHHNIIERLNKTPKGSYIQLANLYVEQEGMEEFFNNYKENLSKFINEAMIYYAENNL